MARGAINNPLVGRDTSKSGDETSVIGRLLKLPMLSLLDLTSEERVSEFKNP